MSEQSAGDTDRKRCRECNIRDAPRFRLDSDDDYIAVLYHYLDEHPDNERFRNVIESTWIETVCDACEQPFFAPMRVSRDGLHFEAYCPECEAEDWIRPLFVRDVTPEELVEWEAEPSEDDLTRSVPVRTDQ